MNINQIAKRTLFLVVLFALSMVARHVILNGVYPIKLQSAPALAASVAPSIASSGSKNLPVPGKDFKILSTEYFDRKQWAVVSVAGIPNMNTAFLVLEKLDGVYTVVVGPGTFFSASVAQSMPSDVATYLMSRGLIH